MLLLMFTCHGKIKNVISCKPALRLALQLEAWHGASVGAEGVVTPAFTDTDLRIPHTHLSDTSPTQKTVLKISQTQLPIPSHNP